MPRIIADNLAAPVAGAIGSRSSRGSGSRSLQYQVVIEVARFDGPLGGAVVLDARWRIIGPDRRDLGERRFNLTEPTGGADVPGARGGDEPALDGLSREIAGALKAL